MDRPMITWDVSPEDWQQPGPDAITTRVLREVRPGSIVLLHDGGGERSGTVEALDRLIPGLRAAGYRFVRIGELLLIGAGTSG